MISDNERRDVAGRLRDSIPADLHLGRGNKAWGLLYLTLFGRYMPNQASGRTYKQVAELLADLIDPEHDRTYHPERVGTAYRSAIVCSECKRRLDEVTLYCPHCGARLEGVGR